MRSSCPASSWENFVWCAGALPLISAHVSTGEPLPVDMLQRACPARAPSMRRWTPCGRSSSPVLISNCTRTSIRPPVPKVAETLASVRQRVAVAPAAPFNRMPASFAHIFAGGVTGWLLQLQVGRSARRERVRSVRTGRHLRQRHRSALSRFHSRVRRRRRCHGCVRALQGAATRCPAAAQQPESQRETAMRRSPWRTGGAGGERKRREGDVSDELVLGVYAEQNQQGQRLTTLHSGTSVEALRPAASTRKSAWRTARSDGSRAPI